MSPKRNLILISVFVLIVAASISFLKINWQEDLFQDLPTHRRELVLARQWLQALAGNEPVVIVVDARSVEQPSTSAVRAAKRLAKQLQATGLFKQINTGLSMTQGQKLWLLTAQRLPYLLSPDDYPEIKKRVEESPQRLQIVKQQLYNPLAFGISRTIQNDPLELTPLVLQRLRHLSNYNVIIHQGCFFSEDKTQLMMTAWPQAPPSDTGQSEKVIRAIQQSGEQVRQALELPQIQFHLIGPHQSYLDNARQIKHDVTLTLLLSIAAIILLTFLTVRRPWLAPMALLPALVGVAIAMLGVGLFFKQFSLIVLGISSALMGITVDYGLHLFHAIEHSRLSPQAASRKIRTPVLVAGLTTACAFLALLVTNFPGQYRIAFFTCLGVLGAMLFALNGLPSIFPTQKSGRAKAWIDLDRIMACIEQWRRAHQRWIVLGLLLVGGLSLYHFSHLQFNGDPQSLNALSPETLQAEAHLGRTFGEPGGRILAFQNGQDEESVLQAAETMDQWLDQPDNKSKMAGRSLAVFLPSQKKQQENRALFEKSFGKKGEVIVRALHDAARQQGFKPQSFRAFQNALANPSAPLTLGDLRDAGLDIFLAGRVFQDEAKGLSLITPIKPQDSQIAEQLKEQLPNQVTSTEVIDMQRLVSAILEIVRTDFKPLFFFTFLIVGFIIILAKGRIEPMLVVLPPVLLAVCMTYGTLAWLGKEINLINMVALPFIVGLGVDYALFSWESCLARHRDQSFSDGSILLAAATTLAAFGMLAIAGHPVLHTVGLSVLLGVFYALLTSILLVPLLMNLFLPTRTEVPPRSLRTLLGGLLIYIYILGGILIFMGVIQPLEWMFFRKNKGHLARVYLRRLNKLLMATFPYGKRIFKTIDTFPEPAILVANHASQVDIVLMLCLANQSMVVKEWVWHNPVLGPPVRNSGFIPVKDGTTESFFEKARAVLARGVSLMFFPEGTRSREGIVQRFHKGAFQLAKETGVKIQPVALLDTRAGIRDSTWVVGPHCIVVKGLSPLDPNDYTGDFAVRDMARAARQRIDQALTEFHHLTAPPKIIRQKIQERFAYQGPMIEQYVFWKLKLDKVYETVDSLLPKSGTIVDMGCGMGLMMHWAALSERDRKLIGLDDDAKKIGVAQTTVRYQPNLTFVQTDILSATPQPAQAVLLLDVLHYWSVEMQKKIVQQAATGLVSEGVLIIREGCQAEEQFTAVSWGERFTTQTGFNKKREGLFFHTRKGWETLFQEAGFSNIETRLCGTGKSNTLFILKK